MPLNYENILFFIIVLNFSTQNGVGYKLWNHNIIATQNILANKSICKIMCLGCSPLLFNSGLILSIVRLKTHVQTAYEGDGQYFVTLMPSSRSNNVFSFKCISYSNLKLCRCRSHGAPFHVNFTLRSRSKVQRQIFAMVYHGLQSGALRPSK